jgi:putative acetyltransferase
MSEAVPGVLIRPEATGDAPAIRGVIVQAFGQAAEADLVEQLRVQGAIVLSLVAVTEAQIVGHILYSPVTLEANAENRKVLGLAPLSVHPHWQQRRIGTALIQASFKALKTLSMDGAVVLGSPDYYPRFGFAPASNFGLRCKYSVPAEDFMAIEFSPHALQGCSGLVQYHPVFSAFDD